MALFVLIAVGIVVAQTWLDWRASKKSWVVPDWAKGMALGGMIAVPITALASFTTVWIQQGGNMESSAFNSGFFWMQLAFLLCVMAIIVFTVRRKQSRSMVLLGAAAAVALWLGVTLLY